VIYIYIGRKHPKKQHFSANRQPCIGPPAPHLLMPLHSLCPRPATLWRSHIRPHSIPKLLTPHPSNKLSLPSLNLIVHKLKKFNKNVISTPKYFPHTSHLRPNSPARPHSLKRRLRRRITFLSLHS